jgi:predicted transcriptional regulator
VVALWCIKFISSDRIGHLYYNVLQMEGMIMSISLRLAEEESNLIKSYAALHGISVTELVRQAVLERIEDEVCSMLEQDV